MTILADFDWGRTPLGSRSSWSPALTTVYDMMMSAHVAMCVAWGPEQTFLYNEAYASFLGPRHPTALGKPMKGVWPEIWDEIEPLVARAMAGERIVFTGMHLVMTRHGREEDTYWDFSYSALRDGADVVGFLIVATESTHHVLGAQRRDLAEAALRAQNVSLERTVSERTRELENLWQLSPDMMLRCTFEGVMTAVNVTWTDVLGWDETELVGANLFDLLHPDDVARSIEGARELSEGKRHARFENRYRHRDGTYRWIEWSTRPDRDGIFASGRDITVVRDQREMLLRTEEALRQAQKMEAVGQLTGGLAHDFNNLLAGISGSLELINVRIGQGRIEDIDKYIVAALGATRRAAALTHRLLAFSRRQTLTPKTTDANALIHGMLDLIRRTVGPGVAVETFCMADLWFALVDPSQLESALLNLCLNARDAMPGGGRIVIETGNRLVDPDGAEQFDLPEGQYLSLCVSDTGTGMPSEVITKAFDPFFTTKPIGEGTGLGLSMIYGFAKQSGGHARIQSEVGRGTTVCIFLPRHLGALEAEAAVGEPGSAPLAEAGETVLVVDDEPTVRMLVADVLDELGYAAIEAADGAGGLTVLRSNARIDLLITDVGLPGGMNGRQLADAARSVRPGLKVLFITGYAENALLDAGQLQPGMAVLTKPFAVDALGARIRDSIRA